MSNQPTSSDPRLDQRIAQFENMTAADPDNDMAHFSLGNAYLQAGRGGEAAERFERVIELNPDMSKAYQLAGQAMIDAGWEDKAVDVLERGWRIAATRGDLMVRDGAVQSYQGLGVNKLDIQDATTIFHGLGGIGAKIHQNLVNLGRI